MPSSGKSKRGDAGTIVVSGTGRVSVVPDTADIRLGVAVIKPKVDAARAEAATIMDAILAARRSTKRASPGAMSGPRCSRSSRASSTARASRPS